MKTIKLSEITRDATLQIRTGLNKKAVERYMQADDLLPPIDLFQIKGKLVIADGWHRYEAASKRGLTEIRANIHQGTVEDAEVFAITSNARHGMPLKDNERNDGILRLREIGWTQDRIASEMSIDQKTVSSVLRCYEVADLVRSAPKSNVYKKQELSQRDCLEIAQADRKLWKPIAQACLKGGWNSKQTAQAVRNLNDPATDEEERKDILNGQIRFDRIEKPDGTIERTVLASTVQQYMQDAKDDDGYAVFLELVNICHRLKHHAPEKIVKQAAEFRGAKELRSFATEITWIEDLLDTLKAELDKRKNGDLKLVSTK